MSELVNQSPSVTAIIPLHNHERWVNDAIDSILHQSYPNKRIVVVDDGSTDNSCHKVTSRLYKPRGPEKQGEPWVCFGKITNFDTELMYCRFQEARGPSFARNWGMKVAWEGTDAFCFLDSDDMYGVGKIEKSVAKWQESPENIGVVYTDFDTLSPSGLRLRQYKEPFSRIRLMQECLPNCDSLVTKEAIAKCGGFDEQMRVCEDLDLWLRLSESYMIVHVAEPLLTIRVGEHSATSTVPSETWKKCYTRAYQKAQARAQEGR